VGAGLAGSAEPNLVFEVEIADMAEERPW